MFKKGSISFHILTLFIISAGIFLVYFTIQNPSLFPGINYLKISFSKTTPADPITNQWNSFNSERLFFKYPDKWLLKNERVSQYPFSEKVGINSVYNLIDFKKVSIQLHPGYTNKDIFDKLYNSKGEGNFKNEWYSSDKILYNIISSGQNITGEKFVIFTDSSKDLTNQEKTIKSLIMEDQNFYHFTLSYYDDYGVEVFNKLLPTVNLK